MLAIPATAFIQTCRPTSSRSAPSPKPRPNAPYIGSDLGERPSSSPSTVGEVKVAAREGIRLGSRFRETASPSPLAEATRIKSVGSFGSLDSTVLLQDNEEDSFLERPRSSSLDTITSSVNRSEVALHSARPAVKICYDLVDIEPARCNQPLRTEVEVTSARGTLAPRSQQLPAGQSLLAQIYKPRRTEPSGLGCNPSPYGEVEGKNWSSNNVFCNPEQAMIRGVMCVLVLGGKTKNSSDMYGRTLDMWKCDIDPGTVNSVFIYWL